MESGNLTLPKCKEYHPLSELKTKPGYYPNLTPDQIKLMHEVNMRISLESLTFFIDNEDHYLKILRFLRARKFDIEAAMEMIRNDAKWRAEEGRSTLQRKCVEEYIKVSCPLSKVWGYYPTWIQGHDKQHRPVSYRKFGFFETWNLLKIASISTIVDFHIWESEQAIRIMHETSRDIGYNVETFTVVIDATGFAFRMLTSDGFAFVRQIAGIDSDHYPERLGTLVVINAPMAVSVAWKVVSGFLDEATRLKIRIIGSDKKEWQSVLFDLIDLDQLPKAYGGTAPDLNFDEAMHGLNPDPAKMGEMDWHAQAAIEGQAHAPTAIESNSTDVSESEDSLGDIKRNGGVSAAEVSRALSTSSSGQQQISSVALPSANLTGPKANQHEALDDSTERQIWAASQDNFITAVGGGEMTGAASAFHARSTISSGDQQSVPITKLENESMPKHISLPALLVPGIEARVNARNNSTATNSSVLNSNPQQNFASEQLTPVDSNGSHAPAGANSDKTKKASTGMRYIVDVFQCKAPICDGTVDESQFDYAPVSLSVTPTPSIVSNIPAPVLEQPYAITSTPVSQRTTSLIESTPGSGNATTKIPHSLLAPLPQTRTAAVPTPAQPARRAADVYDIYGGTSVASHGIASRSPQTDGFHFESENENKEPSDSASVSDFRSNAGEKDMKAMNVDTATTTRSKGPCKPQGYQAPDALHSSPHAGCSGCCIIA